jgi:hypothetical protein
VNRLDPAASGFPSILAAGVDWVKRAISAFRARGALRQPHHRKSRESIDGQPGRWRPLGTPTSENGV